MNSFSSSSQTGSRSMILRVASLVSILVVVVVVSMTSGDNTMKGNAALKSALVRNGELDDSLKMYRDETKRVKSQAVSPILNAVPREMLLVKPDFPPGYIHIMTCGHDQTGKLFWNELNGGLAGVQSVAKTKAVVLRFYDGISGKWVESTVILNGAAKSVSDNLKANTVLNGNVAAAHRGSAWRDFNFQASQAATMGILGFSCDPYTYSKGTFAAGSVYFACGNAGGLHINKVGPTAPWNGVCTFNTPNARKNTHVLLYYKTVLC